MILPLALSFGTALLGVSVSPARLALVAPASRTIEVRNTSAERVKVEVSRKSVDGRGTKTWLEFRPARMDLRAGGAATVTLRAGVRSAVPGDHQLLLLFVGRPLNRGGVAVRLRLGVPVRVRMPGRIVRRLDIRGVLVRRHKRIRVLLVSVANAGNVTEQLRGLVTVTIARRGRVLSRLRPRRPRELFPATRTVLALPYMGRAHGVVTAVVRARDQERRYRLRL